MKYIIDIIIKIAGALVAASITYLAPKAKAWLEAKTGKEKADKLYALIDNFVEAAEQQFSAEKSGKDKKQYVEAQLRALGYAMNAELNAYIEAAVLRLNK